MPHELHERLGGASTVLLCAPGFGGDDRSACTDLLVGGVDTGPSVLWVSCTRPPSACVAGLRERGVSLDRGAVIVLGEGRSDESLDGVTVEQVGSPQDLTGLGIAVRRYVEAWADDDTETVVCFDSLTSLLQYVDLETAYEFLHVLAGQLRAAGATAHFHLDPEAHEDRAVATLTALFDARATVDDDGVSVRRRPTPGESGR